jgi:hypothetical protein
LSSPVALPIPDVPPAQASEILCGPWAAPSDIPEKWRANASDNQWLVTLDLAAEVLYALTGHRWRGVGCSDRMVLRSRPAAMGQGDWPYLDAFACDCWAVAPGYGSVTTYADAWLFNAAWRGLHPTPMAVELEADAMAITRVELADGTDLDPAAYRLSKSGWAERIDGQGWSLCGATGPTILHYDKGQNPPGGGISACVNLAIEFVRSWCGDANCALPRNTTQVTRQGVSITMDTSAFLKERRTGVPIVDLWVEAVNPRRKDGTRPIRQGSVWSPDIPTGTRISPPA